MTLSVNSSVSNIQNAIQGQNVEFSSVGNFDGQKLTLSNRPSLETALASPLNDIPHTPLSMRSARVCKNT